jgi:hypothetical protein
MCVLTFSTKFSETFFILRRTERDVIKIVNWSSCKVPRDSCPILLKLEFFGQFFVKFSNVKFHASRGETDERMEGQT